MRAASRRSCVTTTRLVAELAIELEHEREHGLGIRCRRDCPWARRRARGAAPSPARAPPRRADARRPTVRAGGGRAAARAPRVRGSRAPSPPLRAWACAARAAAWRRFRAPRTPATGDGTGRRTRACDCAARRAVSRRAQWMSLPATLTVPAVGLSSPPRICSSVVLPEPEAPMIARRSPARTARFTPCSTSRSIGPWRNARVTSRRFEHRCVIHGVHSFGSCRAITHGAGPRQAACATRARQDRESPARTARAPRSVTCSTSPMRTSDGRSLMRVHARIQELACRTALSMPAMSDGAR